MGLRRYDSSPSLADVIMTSERSSCLLFEYWVTTEGECSASLLSNMLREPSLLTSYI
jgi:hypothetical protein